VCSADVFTSPLAGEVGARSAPGEGGAPSIAGLRLYHPHPPSAPSPASGRRGMLATWFDPPSEQRGSDQRDQRGQRNAAEHIREKMIVLVDARERDEYRDDQKWNSPFRIQIRQRQEQAPEECVVTGRE